MRIEGELCWARFFERKNRFAIHVELDDKIECFLPNPGRLEDILTPGRMILLRKAKAGGSRRTSFDVLGASLGEEIVVIDSRIPNALFHEAIDAGRLQEFRGYRCTRSEPSLGESRFDFLLEPDCLVEVKSCTLVKDGVALFPDAPTSRGIRHMLGLEKALGQGYRACVVFVVQREARLFGPNWDTDPEFGRALRSACRSGVEAFARLARWQGRELELGERIAMEE
jgi:sugar fermentation stimulation protein A